MAEVTAKPLDRGASFLCELLGSLHCSALLSRAGVNEFVLMQLFEDEKCRGRALLLLPCMKRSAPDPTVLCLATGCHSCSTHNAAESRKEKCLPSNGQQHFPEPLLVLCTVGLFAKGPGVSSSVRALLMVIFRETEQQLCFPCLPLHWEMRSKLNTFKGSSAGRCKALRVL